MHYLCDRGGVRALPYTTLSYNRVACTRVNVALTVSRILQMSRIVAGRAGVGAETTSDFSTCYRVENRPCAVARQRRVVAR